MTSTFGGDARPEQFTTAQTSAQLRARLEARLTVLQALVAEDARQQLIQQFNAARPTTAQIRGRCDLNHQQIDHLLAGPCTKAASKSVDRYLAIAEALDAFAARLEAIS
jgi:hypothetical protein